MIRLNIIFLILYPIVLHGQLFLSNNFNSPYFDNIKNFSMINTQNTNIFTLSFEHHTSIDFLLDLFNQQKYQLFLKESQIFLTKNPQTFYSNELLWMEGHALWKTKQFIQAKSKLLLLISSTNLQLKHRALFDLAGMTLQNNDIINTLYYLNIIHNSPHDSPFKEITHAKLIDLAILQKNNKLIKQLINDFKALYPNSLYLNQLQYLLILYEFHDGNTQKATQYAINSLKKQDNPFIRRILAEIYLANAQYNAALTNLLNLTTNINPFQDEALFKAALIYKMKQQFTNSQELLLMLTKYFKNSYYYQRGLEELANINILLQNYDEALKYYLYQSGFSGTQKASALLKIAEIYFLKGNTKTTQRTANRIQRDFPYSAYANEALYWLGRTYIIDKEFQKSINTFDSYLIREPQSPKRDEIQIFLGHSYANINNQAKARYYFQQILGHSTNNFLKRTALLGLGRSYNLKEPERSLQFFDEIWKEWPDSSEAAQALYFSGATRYNLRKNKDARKNFVNLTNSFPHSLFYQDSILALAKLDFKSEKFDNIVDSKEISLTSKNRELVSEFKELQARSFFRQKNFHDALHYFQEATHLTTNHIKQTELFLAEASTLRNLGKYTEAVKKYEKYLSRMSKDEHLNDLQELLWSEIVWSYIEAHFLTKAEKTIKYILNHYPQSNYLNDIYFKLADEYFVNKKYLEAAAYYQKVQTISKDKDIIIDAQLRESWSLYYAHATNSQRIIEQFIKNYPHHVAIPDLMIKLSDYKNEHDQIELRKQLIAHFPDSPEAEDSRLFLVAQFNNASPKILNNLIISSTDKRLKAKYSDQLAQIYLKEQKTNQALELYEHIHNDRDPILGAEAAFSAAQILNNQGKYTDSLKLYINIIASYNKSFYPQALDKIIQNYILLKDSKNAEKFKKRLIQQFPHSKESQKWL